MTNNDPINNAEELSAEKVHLQQEVDARKEAIMTDIRELKKELSPVKQAADMASNVFIKKYKGWIQTAANVGVDLILSRFLLRRAALPIRFFVPMLVKNVAGNYLNQHQHEIGDKVIALLRKWIEDRRRKQMIRKLMQPEIKLIASESQKSVS
jgi:hypothetical protein